METVSVCFCLEETKPETTRGKPNEIGTLWNTNFLLDNSSCVRVMENQNANLDESDPPKQCLVFVMF